MSGFYGLPYAYVPRASSAASSQRSFTVVCAESRRQGPSASVRNANRHCHSRRSAYRQREVELLFDALKLSVLCQDDGMHNDLIFVDESLLRELRNDVPLPKITMSAPGSFFIRRISAAGIALHQLSCCSRTRCPRFVKRQSSQIVHSFRHNRIVLDSLGVGQ